jgi:Zn-dependent M28 family amino/carboxypeptidase
MSSAFRLTFACAALLLGGLGLAAAVAPSSASADAQDRIAAAPILHDIAAISADSTEGRAPGTPGDRKARGYLIRRLQAIGFRPGGPGGSWEQPITFVGLTVKNLDAWRFAGPAGEAVFRWRQDFIGGSGVQALRVSFQDADVVFVGYGIQAPEYQWDDFKGADLKGKVLLILNNDPDWDPALFAGQKRLYYGRWDYKYETAARQGAAAAIILHTEESAGYGWNVVERSWSGTQFELPAAGEPRLGLKSWLTEPAVRRLCALGGKDLDSLIAAARRREFTPIPLGVKTSLAFDVGVDTTLTANVVGILPGSDPKLRDEAVILTAHHDHLGIGQPDSTGDRIHNGALDNASGCAQVLAIADAFAATRPRPRRSVIALFVAGEEQGLLGSQYYAAHPTVPLARIAADLNIDGGNVLGRTSDVAVIGKGKSDLEDRLVAAAQGQGRTVVDEPEPDKGYYYRSDQLSFAHVGVPALYFRSGQTYIGRPEGWGKEKEAEYRRLHYHQPSDQILPDWDLSGMVEDARLVYLVGLDVANGAKLPAWYPGDEFEAARRKTLERSAAGAR